MPDMVQIAFDPAFKPDTKEDKEAVEAAKKAGPKTVSRVTAVEAIRNSRGLYRIVAAEPEATAITEVRLEDRSSDELKVMMLSLGITPRKQMKRTEIITLIQSRLDAVEIVGDDED